MTRNRRTVAITLIAAALLAAPAALAQANPASEAAVRRMTDEVLRGEVNYGLMSEQLAQAVRPGEAALLQMFAEMGPFRSVVFVETAAGGADVFDVTHANGIVRWTVQLAPDGRTSNAFVRRFIDARPAQAPAGAGAAVQPAIDGLFAAFETHPIVAIGDDHGLTQEMEFYADLIRDPRFAREVGNVVVEFGAAGRQDVVDRYLAGETVAYTELRTVWADTVGWFPPAGHVGFVRFLATVRAVNAALPPDKRIRVWLGEPPIDWPTATAGALRNAMSARDSHPAEIVVDNILAEGRKALVIYGHFHFAGPQSLRGMVEAEHPGAFFVVLPYSSAHQPAACAPFLEAAARVWPAPALTAPADAPDPAMRECMTLDSRSTGLLSFTLQETAPGEGPPPPQPVADAPPAALMVEADAVLFLGPLEALTRETGMPDYLLDAEYRGEMDRRSRLGAAPLIRFPPGLTLRKADYAVDLGAPGYAARLDAMFAEHDRNGDGVVTADEYVDPVALQQEGRP